MGWNLANLLAIAVVGVGVALLVVAKRGIPAACPNHLRKCLLFSPQRQAASPEAEISLRVLQTTRHNPAGMGALGKDVVCRGWSSAGAMTAQDPHVLEIALLQRQMIWCFPLAILSKIILTSAARMFDDSLVIGVTLLVAMLPVAGAAIVMAFLSTFKLTSHLAHKGVAAVVMVLMLLPPLFVICTSAVAFFATRRLQAAGMKVGLLGVAEADIAEAELAGTDRAGW